MWIVRFKYNGKVFEHEHGDFARALRASHLIQGAELHWRKRV